VTHALRAASERFPAVLLAFAFLAASERSFGVRRDLAFGERVCGFRM
jgi:hypothetical protein